MRIVIIHGWGAAPNGAWRPWLKEKLEGLGCEVIMPAMPNPDTPRIEEWVPIVEDLLSATPQQTIAVGHSLGCVAIARALAFMANPIVGSLWVTPAFRLTNLSEEERLIAQPWEQTTSDVANLSDKVLTDIVSILSTNDEWVPFEESHRLLPQYSPHIIVAENQGHLNDASGTTSLPMGLQIVADMVSRMSLRNSQEAAPHAP